MKTRFHNPFKARHHAEHRAALNDPSNDSHVDAYILKHAWDAHAPEKQPPLAPMMPWPARIQRGVWGGWVMRWHWYIVSAVAAILFVLGCVESCTPETEP